jgi:hypothetical protein
MLKEGSKAVKVSTRTALMQFHLWGPFQAGLAKNKSEPGALAIG